jgi:hypothetical protein
MIKGELIMTCELALMNKSGVAVAADSAVSFGSEGKVFNSADKIFMLSKYAPIGVITYNNTQFMGITLEVLIKYYRNEILKTTKFDSLEMYRDDFLNFLQNFESLLYINSVNSFNDSIIISKIIRLLKFSKIDLKNFEKPKKSLRREFNLNIKNDLTRLINMCKYKDIEEEINISEDNLNTFFEDNIFPFFTIEEKCTKEIKELFLMLNLDNKKLIKKYFRLFFSYNSDIRSGLVFVGYGEKEIFPSLCETITIGKINSIVIYKNIRCKKISLLNTSELIPFAQSYEIEKFIYGIDLNLLYQILKFFEEFVEDKIEFSKENIEEKNKVKKSMSKYISKIVKNNYKAPFNDILATLNKKEIASVVETLVNLASFKKKYSKENETVGGPIDVAVISKSEGFVWIKRKHYFKKDLNHQFFDNYY